MAVIYWGSKIGLDQGRGGWFDRRQRQASSLLGRVRFQTVYICQNRTLRIELANWQFLCDLCSNGPIAFCEDFFLIVSVLVMVVMVADDIMARMGPKGGPVYSHSEWTESSLHKIQVTNGSDFWRNNQIRQTAIHHCHLDDISLSNDNHHKITDNNQDQKNEKKITKMIRSQIALDLPQSKSGGRLVSW